MKLKRPKKYMRATIQYARYFALDAHRDQVRKYTGEPYATHVFAVAKTVEWYGGDVAQIAAALLHDTVEDTAVTNLEIERQFGPDVALLVAELTNVYEKKAYPHLNRTARKRLEAQRLGQISARAQTIKFADFLDNGADILANDPKFAKVYIAEALHDLSLMHAGDPKLKSEVLNLLDNRANPVQTT